MRTETSEAFSRLVTTFVIAIEDAGGTLPADMEQRLTASPLKACELLNELALTCGGIDPDTDSVLAAIYESMDAADARTPLDEAGAARIVRALNRAHKEPAAPEPKPEPEPRPAHAEPEVWESPTKDGGDAGQAEDGASPKPAEEAERKPGRRGRAARARQEKPERDGQDAGTEASAPAAADEASPRPEHKTRRSRHAAEKDGAPTVSEGEAATPSPEPAQAEQEEGAKAPVEAPAGPARSAEEAGITGDVLTVDQAIAALGLSRPTIYKFIENGKLPAFKKGRSWQISADAVAALADK